MEITDGDYVRVEEGQNGGVHGEAVHSNPCSRDWRLWVKAIVLCSLISVLAVILCKWIGPLLMKKVVIPFINWEMRTLDTEQLAFAIFASIALLPVILLPTSPSMWIAGLSFGYGFGFLLVMAGVAVGITLPYFIGSLFELEVQKWLEKYPEQASVLRSAGEGTWFHQFKAVTLMRISPFPYVVFNYAVVAADIAYTPYLLGSLIGTAPEVLLSLYSGILIRAIADATDDHVSLSKPQAIFNALGLCATLVATVMIGIWVKMRLTDQKQISGTISDREEEGSTLLPE